MNKEKQQKCAVLDREGAIAQLGIDGESYAVLLGLMQNELAEWNVFFSSGSVQPREALRTGAHRLKSDAANVGAQCVRQAAAALEMAIRNSADDGEVETYLTALRSALEELARTVAS